MVSHMYLGRDRGEYVFRSPSGSKLIRSPETKTLFPESWSPSPGDAVSLESMVVRYQRRGRPAKWFFVRPC
jgi:hypothetical protein